MYAQRTEIAAALRDHKAKGPSKIGVDTEKTSLDVAASHKKVLTRITTFEHDKKERFREIEVEAKTSNRTSAVYTPVLTTVPPKSKITTRKHVEDVDARLNASLVEE